MPYAAPSRCTTHGCNQLATYRGRCRVHRDMRPNSTQRGYGTHWRRLRGYVLMRDPTCTADGCTALSTEVAHRMADANKAFAHFRW